MRKLIIAAAALPLLAGCSGGAEPGDLSAEESRQLDEAAAMLDNAENGVVSGEAGDEEYEQIVIEDPVAKE